MRKTLGRQRLHVEGPRWLASAALDFGLRCGLHWNRAARMAHSHRGYLFMPNDSHQRAAEFHDMAAHAHRAAATHHGKEDHLSAHELSRQALEHARKAFEASQVAFEKSAAALKNQPK